MVFRKPATPVPSKGVNTEIFAANNLVEAQTVRKRYSQTGSYHSIVPKKLANGRLLWPNLLATKRLEVTTNDTREVQHG